MRKPTRLISLRFREPHPRLGVQCVYVSCPLTVMLDLLADRGGSRCEVGELTAGEAVTVLARGTVFSPREALWLVADTDPCSRFRRLVDVPANTDLLFLREGLLANEGESRALGFTTLPEDVWTLKFVSTRDAPYAKTCVLVSGARNLEITLRWPSESSPHTIPDLRTKMLTPKQAYAERVFLEMQRSLVDRSREPMRIFRDAVALWNPDVTASGNVEVFPLWGTVYQDSHVYLGDFLSFGGLVAFVGVSPSSRTIFGLVDRGGTRASGEYVLRAVVGRGQVCFTIQLNAASAFVHSRLGIHSDVYATLSSDEWGLLDRWLRRHI